MQDARDNSVIYKVFIKGSFLFIKQWRANIVKQHCTDIYIEIDFMQTRLDWINYKFQI